VAFCGERPPYSAGHVADWHRLPDSLVSKADQHPETPLPEIIQTSLMVP